jgi:hypothetical protein
MILRRVIRVILAVQRGRILINIESLVHSNAYRNGQIQTSVLAHSLHERQLPGVAPVQAADAHQRRTACHQLANSNCHASPPANWCFRPLPDTSSSFRANNWIPLLPARGRGRSVVAENDSGEAS